MKKILLLPFLLLLVHFVPAQTSNIASKLTKTWVLQNPEYAAFYTVLHIYANGQATYNVTNLLNDKSISDKFSWKLNEKKDILTLSLGSENYQYRIILTDENELKLTNVNNSDDYNWYAELGSPSDVYLGKVEFAIKQYGNDASLRKFGMASSSREYGYTFKPRYENCYGCFGLGRCTNCSGSGQVTYNFRDYLICPSCRGTGACYLCNGKGKIKNY